MPARRWIRWQELRAGVWGGVHRMMAVNRCPAGPPGNPATARRS